MNDLIKEFCKYTAMQLGEAQRDGRLMWDVYKDCALIGQSKSPRLALKLANQNNAKMIPRIIGHQIQQELF